MRLGCCGTIDQANAFKAAGFDFLEVNVQHVLRGDEPSSTWDASAPDPARMPLPIEAANCLVPAQHPIIGPRRDLTVLQDYMQRVAKRAQRLGLSRLVFGSGGARRQPEGVDHDTALAHLMEFTRMAGEMCAHHDVILVIEHLNAKETNTLNKLAQAQFLCDRVHLPNVAVLVDSYHFGLERERDDALLDLGDRIRHVHVAEPVDRLQPGGHALLGEPAKGFDFEHFFGLLRKVGYDERIAIEASKWTNPVSEIGPQVIAMLKQTWRDADRVEA